METLDIDTDAECLVVIWSALEVSLSTLLLILDVEVAGCVNCASS